MQFKHTTLGLAVFASLFGTSAAIAQDDIETISVIGARQPIELSRLSASVSVIDRAEIENSGALNLADILRSQAGISISQSGAKGTETRVRLRGSESNHILVLVDGVEINNLSDGAVDFAHVNLDNVERIELLRGPQSALWGSGAVAGVLNITTRQGTEQTRGGARIEVGEDSSAKLAANVSGAADAFNYALSVSHFSTDGQNISAQGNERDGYRNNEFNTQLGYKLSEQARVTANLRYVDSYNEYDAGGADAELYTHGRFASGKLGWYYTAVDTRWQHEAGYQFSRSETVSNLTSEADSNKQRWYWQSALNYSQAGRIAMALEHVDEEFTQIGLASVWGDPNQTQENQTQSAVLDVVHEVLEGLSLTANSRYDSNDEFDDALTFRLGGSYLLDGGHKIYISHGKAVKNPTLVERFGYFPADFLGNPALEPEKSISTELGGQYQINADWFTELNLYFTDLENEINGSFFDLANGRYTAINVAENSKRRGAEWQLKGTIGELKVDLNYSYLDAKEKVKKTDPPRVEEQTEVRRPRHQANLTLSQDFFEQKANAYIQLQYQGTREDTFFGTYPYAQLKLNAVTLVNAAVSFKPDQHWTFALRAENLFDHDYDEVIGYQRQGRTAYISAGYQF